MQDDKNEIPKEAPEFYEGMELPEEYRPKDMDRSSQTFWIVAAVLLVGAVIVYFQTRLPEGHPYKHCETIFGVDEFCRLGGHP